MKFKLGAAKSFYDEKEMKDMKKLGFKFKPHGIRQYLTNQFDVFIEIKTIKELMNFIKKYGAIVLDEDTLTLYNGYLE